jgi:hypothetical protein
MPLILGANSVTGGYEIDNSLRFNVGSSDSLERTVGSGGSTTTGTISFWVKRGDTGATQYFYANKNTVSNAGFGVLLSSDSFYVFQYDGTSPFNPANYQINLITSSVFRDYSAWYHFVLVIDTSNGTEANRIRLYVNGTQQTLNKTGNMPTVTLNLSVPFLYDGGVSKICSDYAGGNFFGGYLSEFNLIDGQALAPSDFGEFDEDSGIWKPIAYEGTYGTNGFYLEFKDSSALGDDTSGNSNDFTVNNLTSIDQTTDTPTNNFATMNPLDNFFAGSTFSNGNCDILTNGSNYSFNTATFALSSGKWYWEAKIGTNTTVNNMFGIADRVATSSTQTVGEFASSYSLLGTGRLYENGSFTNSWGSSYTTGDIMSVALDLDNNRLYFAKNGTWQNSADPTTGTGAVSITAPSSVTSGNGYYFPAFGDFSGSDDTDWLVNFGNPTFTISSGNSDANGYGNFEYAVPSGYYALNTKNLAEYG